MIVVAIRDGNPVMRSLPQGGRGVFLSAKTKGDRYVQRQTTIVQTLVAYAWLRKKRPADRRGRRTVLLARHAPGEIGLAAGFNGFFSRPRHRGRIFGGGDGGGRGR